MNVNFCGNCGTPIKPGMKFCPNCGQSVVKIETSLSENESSKGPKPNQITRSGGYVSLAVVANFITMVCLMIAVYDVFEQSWRFKYGYADRMFYSTEMMNSLRISIVSSVAVSIFVILGGIKKFSTLGSVLMAAGGFVTACSVVFVMSKFDIMAWPTLLTYIYSGWLVVSLLYLWTILFNLCFSVNKILFFALCLGTLAIYVCIFAKAFFYA